MRSVRNLSMSYRLIPYSENLDLSEFYAECDRRGFQNNSSQRAMFDCFRNEREWAGWLLEYNQEIVGGVCAHSFDDVMGAGSYRLLTRTVVFSDRCHRQVHSVRGFIHQHQSVASQIYIPAAIAWAGTGKRFFATSNNNQIGDQQRVNRVWFPKNAQQGTFKNAGEIHYRGWDQTVWELNLDTYYQQLRDCPKWQCEFPYYDPRP